MKKIFLLILICLPIIASINSVSADYNYGPNGLTIASAESMSVSKVIDNSNLVDVNNNRVDFTFGEIKDVFVYEDKIYVSDKTNHKVYVLNSNYQYESCFPSTDSNGEILENEVLKQPQGLFVSNGLLYVCDTGNNRVAIFDIETKSLVQEVKDPDDPVFSKTTFTPESITVDVAGRMYVISDLIYEGILDFNSDGTFSRFFGTQTITMSVWDAFVYKFLTSDEQKAQQSLNLQASFENLTIDSYGYIYTVSNATTEDSDIIKKLNFKGTNVLNANGYVLPVGDTTEGETTKFVDIAVNDSGNRYTAIDSARGHIFTYDTEGNLLYICGELGDKTTSMKQPSSVTYYNDDFIVTDTQKKSILVYSPTDFGKLINEANDLYLDAQYEESRSTWEQVLELNSNYYLAYAGIGKAELRAGNYEEAMEYLKIGYDTYNYSSAYAEYRSQKLTVILPYVLVVGFVLVGYLFVKSMKTSIKRDEVE